MRFTQEISIFKPHAIEYAVTSLGTRITQTAAEIRLEASQTLSNYSTTIQMNSAISQKADQITTEVSQTYATQSSQTAAVNSLSSRITQNATSISTEVTARQNGDSALSSRITQNANSITSEVTARQNGDNSLSSRITQNANSISSEVTARQNGDNSLSSRINQSAHTITLGVSGKAGKTSGASITISLKDANGNTISSGSGNVLIDGNVIFSSQLTDGTTTISGSNIKTGTIDASLVTVANINASNITTGTLTGRTISGGSLIQTVSGAQAGGISGNDSNGEQAKIQNGIVTCGELAVKGSVTTVSLVPEGGDGRGSYGIYCTGHFSTEGALWTNGEIGEADIICRGNAFAQNFIQSSDRDLKQDIEDLTEEEACRVVYGLNPVTFALKEQPKVKNHGFIAQDVQPLIKDNWGIVTETDIRMIGDRKALGINYTELIADLVAVAQSQDKRLEALERGNNG